MCDVSTKDVPDKGHTFVYLKNKIKCKALCTERWNLHMERGGTCIFVSCLVKQVLPSKCAHVLCSPIKTDLFFAKILLWLWILKRSTRKTKEPF